MFGHRFNNRGVSVVEYALLAALIGSASVLAVTTLGTQTASLFEREDLRLADSNGGGDSGSGGSTGSGDGLGDHRATQNLDMSLFRIVNVNDPLNPSDAATKGYVDTTVAAISTAGDDLGDHTATQNLDLATNRIVNLGAPQDPADATTKAYVDAAVAGIPGGDNLGNHTATQNIALANNWLSADGSSSGIRITANGDVGIGTSSPRNNSEWITQTIQGTRGGVLELQSSDGALFGRIFSEAADSSFRLANQKAGPLVFITNAAERMRVDSNGLVGIGTSSPSDALHVVGNIRGGSTANPRFTLTNTSGVDSTIQLGADSGSVFVGSFSNSIFQIYANSAERMRITNSGTVLIGATNTIATEPGFKFYPTGSAGSFFASFINGGNGGTNMFLGNSNSSTGSWSSIVFLRGTSAVGSISNSSSGTSYNTTSDYRLKEEFSPIEGALQRIARLRPQSFVFKSDPSRLKVEGFVAHEVAEVAPYAVTGQKDDIDESGEHRYQQVDYGRLTPLLTAGLIEASERLDQLREELQEKEYSMRIFELQRALGEAMERIERLEAEAAHR